MEILGVDKVQTREGFDNYYFKVLNNKNKEYSCSIIVNNNKFVRYSCQCEHYLFEVSRKIKTYKICRHGNLCLDYLHKKGILK